MRIVIIGLLYICFMLAGNPEWLAGTDVPYIVRALTYSFFHANVFHLAVNGLAVWMLWNPKWGDRKHVRELFLALVIAFLAYPLGIRPCVGFSNVLFAAGGLRYRYLLSGWSWRKGEIIFFYTMMIGMCFIPQIAGTNHVAAYLLGMAFSSIGNCFKPVADYFKQIFDDARRYTADR